MGEGSRCTEDRAHAIIKAVDATSQMPDSHGCQATNPRCDGATDIATFSNVLHCNRA